MALPLANWRELANDRRIDAFTVVLALCAVPLSIAVAETLLAIALIVRLTVLVRHRVAPRFPQIFWFWLLWAGLELLSWFFSGDLEAGTGEMRHLLLIAALFLTIPALDKPVYAIAAWQGIFLAATLSSGVLIATFFWRLALYRHASAPLPDPTVYLRNGGLLHHWMVYGTVEVLVFAGLLEYSRLYPAQRRWLVPIFAINGLAIVLSLTRILWVACLVLLTVHWFWHRSKWIWSVPVLPVVLFLLAPPVVRTRVIDSCKPDYYSNTERVQMLRVGLKMIAAEPLKGVGPGRVESKYRSFLKPSDPVPAYYGHLHDNAVQLAAEFGLPAAAAAVLFLCVLWITLRKTYQSTCDRDLQFLSRAGLLGVIGFVVAGVFEYTYGHSLALIMMGFVGLAPLVAQRSRTPNSPHFDEPIAAGSTEDMGRRTAMPGSQSV